jgi:N-acetylglucosaminyldiphosphoundecaprenol N-acetyl-beta-D-mannosaminyltransferase
MSQPQESLPVRSILGVNVVASSYGETVRRSVEWAAAGESRALFFANVHMVMEAFDDRAFREHLNRVDMVNPDGMPLVWALRALGVSSAERVYGPDATVAMLAIAEDAGIAVGFYGGRAEVLEALIHTVQRDYPRLKIVFRESPPFRRLTAEEDAAVVDRMRDSGVRLLFVGLGCPKQEKWIIGHVGRVPAVMFGVGAAFDFLAGTKAQAPRWMMRAGLEWAFRLMTEPRRLAGRYLRHNPRFVVLFLRQLFAERWSEARG